MADIADLAPGKGERVITIGGTRSGKSALSDMTMLHIQRERPTAMQALVDTKPRYRAEKERGLHPKWRRPAEKRYTGWEKGPMIPNSVAVDIWDDHPFRGIWNEPGEIAILQGAEVEDWRRILHLLRGFVNAQLSGVERRIVVDECMDFTSGTRLALTRATTCSTVPAVPEVNVASEQISTRSAFTGYRHSCLKWSPASTCFISAPTTRCAIFRLSASRMLSRRRETTYSASTRSSQAGRYPSHSRDDWNCPNGTRHNSRRRESW